MFFAMQGRQGYAQTCVAIGHGRWPNRADQITLGFQGFCDFQCFVIIAEHDRLNRGTLDRFISLEAQGSDQMREELRLLRDAVFAFGEPAEKILCEGLELLENTDLIAACSDLKTPSLWCAGKRDRLVSASAMQTASAMASGEFLAIPGGGHAPFLTHADQVATAILNFYKRLA